MKNKERIQFIIEGVSTFPNKIFEMSLSNKCIIVYVFICSLNEDFNPSVRYIANKLSLSKTTVVACMKKLCSYNIIEKIYIGNKFVSNKYQFVHPDKWI